MFRAKVTNCIFYLALRFPWVFTQNIRWLAENNEMPKHESLVSYDAEEDLISEASLFAGQVTWKGISLITAIDRSDLTKIYQWMNRQKGPFFGLRDGHKDGIYSTDLISLGVNDLGYIGFKPNLLLSVRNLTISSRLPESCWVSVLRLKNGVSYLSLYICFKELVRERISGVDVRHVKRYACFQSFNPFSPRFLSLDNYDRRTLIREFVYGNAREVVSEAHQAASVLLKLWGVGKEVSDFSMAADFFREGAGSYFDSEDKPVDHDHSASHFTVVSPSSMEFIREPLSKDDSEDYLEQDSDEDITKKIGVKAVFIKSHLTLENEENTYSDGAVRVTERYCYLLMLLDLYVQLQQCMKDVSPIFFKFDYDVQQDLKVLLKASLALNSIDEKLTAIEEGLYWSDANCREYTHERLLRFRSALADFKSDVDKRKELTNSELQLTNLIWIKRYSVIVFFLVIVQIALAVLNVDWRTEEGLSKNPMYINLFGGKKQ
jgi:hypothetical protein